VKDYPHGDFTAPCTLCHSSDAWIPARIRLDFDHGQYGFALTGAHRQTECRACHTLVFDAADTACVSCHSDVHGSELGTDCARCHTTRSFIDRFEMERAHALTRFPLRGTHRALDCEDCHHAAGGSLRFVGTPMDCVVCHERAYLAASDPDHAASGFSRECDDCHSALGWTPARFDHAGVASTPCAACHLGDYLRTVDPDHEQVGFAQTCNDCHGTNAWIPAGFDHAAVAGTPCADCHLSDFQSATDPNHVQAGFPQTCEACHGTVSWVPADFGDHDALWFPIYGGRHRDEWTSCTDCHTVTGNFATFSCITCHEHANEGEVANDHDEVGGYQYDSQACYACHPTGN
jgi:hypothetical protein